MLFVVMTWSAAILVIFCLIFFIVSGAILLLDTVHILNIRDKAREKLSRIFYGTILAGLAAAVVFLFSPGTLNSALQQASEERERALVAEAHTESVVEEIRSSSLNAINENTSIVFIHTFERSRRDVAESISAILKANGILAPGIDGLDIKVLSDQLRFFHQASEARVWTH